MQLALPEEAKEILRGISKLRRRYESYRQLSFSPDGHLVGHLGVAVAAEAFELTPLTESQPSRDAIDAEGRAVEIKATGGTSVAFRCLPENQTPPGRLIVIKFDWDKATAHLIYDGPYSDVIALAEGRVWGANGQMSFTLPKIAAIGATNACC